MLFLKGKNETILMIISRDYCYFLKADRSQIWGHFNCIITLLLSGLYLRDV